MRKRIAFILFLFYAALFLTGCRQRQPELTVKGYQNAFLEPLYDWGENTKETLVIWGIYPEMERSYIKKAFERYEKLTGNHLFTVQIPKIHFESRMKEAFNGNAERPDIVLSYGGTNIEPYQPEENFYDFSGAVWVDDLTDTAINQTVYNGKIIGLPHWESSISGTLYNKKIFQKYNIDIPKTQEEFMKVCEKLSGEGITPLYMPGKEISMLLYQFPLDTVVEDPEVLDGLNEGALNYSDIPEMKEIVAWYKKMAENGYLGETYQTDDWDGMSDAMSSEKYAMMLCWDTWLYTDFKGDPDRFGLMPSFMGTPEAGTFEGPNLGLFLVNRQSDKLEAACNFITFLADPYNYNAAFEGVYTAPIFKNQIASISTPQYLEAERLIERNYRDSTAWLRIRGFSQMDASCILEYMSSGEGETAEECLQKMDSLRLQRLNR